MIQKPEFKQVVLDAVDGWEVCRYVAEKHGIEEYDVFEIILAHHLGTPDGDFNDALIELIIEQETYCNDEGEYYRVLETIVEEFGGHFNINFLSMCAYM